MPCTIWQTGQVEPSRRFDYYRSGLCSSFVRLSPGAPDDPKIFDATLKHWAEGAREFTILSACSHSIDRTRRDVVEAEDEHIYLNFVASGELWMDQLGARRCVRPGDLLLVDNARPFQAKLRRTRGHRLFVYRMDRALISAGLDDVTHRLSRHELSPTLKQMLAFAARADSDWGASQIVSAAEGIEGLLRVILSDDSCRSTMPRVRATLAKVRSIVAARCCDPELGLGDICAELNLSRRSVQAHLSLCGETFITLLNAARLDRAQASLLASGRNGASIERICYDCGFGDLSRFYRAYKRRFGVPPGASRRG